MTKPSNNKRSKIVLVALVAMLLILLCAYRVSHSHAATVITVHAGDNLQSAINDAQCGSIIIIDTGTTFDAPGPDTPFTISRTCTANNPIVVQSANISSLPSGRVSPSDATNMARIRAVGGAGAIRFISSAAYWKLDGLEITNTAQVSYGLINEESGASRITKTRLYMHPKEVGTNYDVSARSAFFLDSSYSVIANSYIERFFDSSGYAILCISCNNVILDNNFIQAWFASLFTGGGGTSPEQTAIATNITNNGATLSNTAGLSVISNAVGSMVRVEIIGTGRFDATTNHFTRVSGPVLTSLDTVGNNGGGRAFWMKTGNIVNKRFGLLKVSGNDYTLVNYSSESPASGTYDWVLFSVVKITGVNGNNVTWIPYGANKLETLPTSGAAVAWRITPVVHDFTITHNNFDISTAQATTKLPSAPKGSFEFKDMSNCLIKGNTFTGFPTVMALVPRSNEGWTPWSAMQDVIIESNFLNFDLVPNNAREAFIAEGEDTYNSSVPSTNIIIRNNLIKNASLLGTTIWARNAIFTHNTVINTNGNAVYGSMLLNAAAPSPGLIFSDNIGQHNVYGVNPNCGTATLSGNLANCWPGLTMRNNILIDNSSQGGLAARYGSGAVLLPVITSFNDVGFINLSSTPSSYRLSAVSPFKGKASDGTDPGIDVDNLLFGLAGSIPLPSPSPIVSPPFPSPTPLATPTPLQTPIPTPSPSPTASTLPTPLPSPSATAQPSPNPSPSNDEGGREVMEFVWPADKTGRSQLWSVISKQGWTCWQSVDDTTRLYCKRP